MGGEVARGVVVMGSCGRVSCTVQRTTWLLATPAAMRAKASRAAVPPLPLGPPHTPHPPTHTFPFSSISSEACGARLPALPRVLIMC